MADLARGFARLEALLDAQERTPVAPGRLLRALDRLQDLLLGQQNPVVDGLLPGLGADVIKRKMDEFGLAAPDDLLSLFGWHDGYRPPAGHSFHGRLTPGVGPAGFEFMCTQYVEYLPHNREWLPPGNERWFPVVKFDGNQRIMMDCGRDTTTAGTVAGHTELGFEGVYHAPTLAEPVEWWCEFIDAGLWVYDQQGFHPSFDYDDFRRLPPRIRGSCMV